jgi:hypothetical protein
MHFCSHKILILLTLDMKITRWFKNGFLLDFAQPTLQGFDTLAHSSSQGVALR